MITIDHMNFELMENYRDAFDEEQFMGKYSEVLNKYDYIVGDIGYEKLRLAGFFRDNKKKIERDKKYSAIEDYLNEYCNFGCAYFVLRKVTKAELKEKDLVADETDEKHPEEDDADVKEASTPEPEKDVGSEAETPQPEAGKHAADEAASEKKDEVARPEEPRVKKEDVRQKDVQVKKEEAHQKNKHQRHEKTKNNNETKNTPPQNKTFASFQKDR